MKVKVNQLKSMIQEATLKALGGSKGKIKESNLPELSPLIKKIKTQLPLIMRKGEWQLPLSNVAKKLGIPDSEKQKLLHLITDPDNTGGIEYQYDPSNDYITAIDTDDNMNTILGREPVHQSFKPNDLDKTEFGNPVGSSIDPDYEDDRYLYDPDTAGTKRNQKLPHPKRERTALVPHLNYESHDQPQWDDYFSSDRESGHEGYIDQIMAKLEAGQPLAKDEIEALRDELSGDRHLAGLKHSSGRF
jgi:hypothetical protein